MAATEVLAVAQKKLPKSPELTRIARYAAQLARACKSAGEFRSGRAARYHYHSGVVLDAYCDGVTSAVARAGVTTRSARPSGGRAPPRAFPFI